MPESVVGQVPADKGFALPARPRRSRCWHGAFFRMFVLIVETY
jgi:hypothetical protein